MPKSPLSPSASRTAVMLAGRMPVIAEDDSLPAVTQPPAAPGLPPPPPSRSTKPKTWARSPTNRPLYPYPSYPPPAYSRRSSRESSRSTVRTRSLPNGSPQVSRSGSGASTPRGTYKDRSRLLPITTPIGPVEDEKSGEKERRMVRRRRHMIVAIIIIIGLIAGLAAGLTAGSRRPNTSSTSSSSSSSSTTQLPSIFPAGSFAFNTALTSAPTNCTSDPSTWRCFPHETYARSQASSGAPNGSLATFFWTIAPRNSYAYQISSSSNPVASWSSNLSMTLLDGNSYNERLVFNFTLSRSVVPSAAVAADNSDKAATCVYADTAFSATLWTRKSGGGSGSVGGASGIGAQDGNSTVVSDGSKWADWPGDIEVLQIKSGGPECKDSEGNQVPVAAGDGRCECRYANFRLSG